VRAAPRAREVHLWRAPLDVSPELVARFATTLSDDEHARAARLRRPADRSRYVSARGWLRHLLAGYLDAEPVDLAFTAGEHGKPRLTTTSGSWLRFNLSHSAALVVFAVARDREVGVDVEEIRDDVDVDIDAISRRLFTPGQCQELAASAAEARATAFFAIWTRNEAYLKATGTGLGHADRDHDRPPGWVLAAFDAGPGFVAAVAVEGDDAEIPAVATDVGGD
jgi:4'-phosphopantetheinyl transferase